MKRSLFSEKLLLEEVAVEGQKTRGILRGLSIGSLIKMIRLQLGMSQKALAKRAHVPQSTISRVEQGNKTPNLPTLNKVLGALFCDLLIVPVLQESIDTIRQKQARKMAEKRVRYLKGTMALEKQEPDSKLTAELLKQEVEHLLKNSNAKLWDD
jgi:transcriptional regulator with XRE-family HTH domain